MATGAAYTYESTSKSVTLSHGALHYNEAGSGPALVMVHGSGPGVTGWANFGNNLPHFTKHFRCLLVDLPGYGKSDPAPGNPMETGPKALAEFVEKLGLERPGFIGNSLGAIVVANLAATRPELVKSICLIGGIGLNIFSPFPNEGLNLLVDFTENPTRENLVRWLRSMAFHPETVTPELIEMRWKEATNPQNLKTMKVLYTRENMQAMAATQFDTQPYRNLSQIECPTLLTWGRDDRVSGVDRALLPMRFIKHCELHTFPNCGHWVMLEAKEAFESVVTAFFQRP